MRYSNLFRLLGILAALTLVLSACTTPAAQPTVTPAVEQAQNAPVATEVTPVQSWNDEDGYAQVGNTTSPRYVNWLWDYIRATYPDAVLTDHSSWWQATIPLGSNQNLIVSWGEFAGEHVLGDIDGVVLDKKVFVAKRDSSDWVKSTSVQHFECVGSYTVYQAQMASWNVDNSTILQFDGTNQATLDFVEAMAKAWSAVRIEWNGCPVPE